MPFHLTIAWSGLIFYMFTYISITADTRYSKDEAQVSDESQPSENRRRFGAVGKLITILI